MKGPDVNVPHNLVGRECSKGETGDWEEIHQPIVLTLDHSRQGLSRPHQMFADKLPELGTYPNWDGRWLTTPTNAADILEKAGGPTGELDISLLGNSRADAQWT